MKNGADIKICQEVYDFPLNYGLSISKTWNSSVFDIERPAGEGRNRIRGA